MKITVDGDLISQALKSVNSLTKHNVVSLKVEKNFLRIISVTGTGTGASQTVPITITEKSKTTFITCNYDALAGALDKRKQLTVELSEAMILIKSSGYRVELVARQDPEEEVIPAEIKANKAIRFKKTFIDAINKYLPKLELRPLVTSALFNNNIPIGIKATAEGTFLACYDNIQASFLFDKELTGNFEIVMPSSVFFSIVKETRGQTYELSYSDAAVYAWNETFELALALSQETTDSVSFSDMLELYDSKLSKVKKGFSIELETELLNTIFSNAKNFYETDSAFTFSVKGDKAKLLLQSSYGKVESMIKVVNKSDQEKTFTCDFMFFASILSKAPKTLKLMMVDNDAMLMFKYDPVTYLMTLI